MIGQTVSHYKILERIGTGGMGAVYKAEDTRLGLHVVLKFLHAGLVSDERAKKRFIHEAQAASALDHPNICAVHGIDETPDGQMFIAMRYYDGESVKERIAARAPLSVREAFQITFSIAQGLSTAHRQGVIHRDIKPANVIVTTEGFVKILDFGLAKIAGRTQLTASDTTLGTVSYMSPEQAGAREVDARTDIWSLGVVLYEMVTGKLPFKGDIDQAMVYSILSLPHVDVREVNADVPDECAALIDKCLEKDPELRFQTTEELLEAIVGLSKELGWGSSIAVGSVIPVSGVVYAERHRRRVGARGLVVAVAVVVAVAIAGWWLTRGEPSPYTTKLRIAVMPIENKAGPETASITNGIGAIATEMYTAVSKQDDSMWVVPYPRVVAGDLADPSDAARAFGVNRVVVGNVQRFGRNSRLTLDFCDAATMAPIRTVYLSFHNTNMTALRDSLGTRLCAAADISADGFHFSSYWPNQTEAVNPYLCGLGAIVGRPQPDQLEEAIAWLEPLAAGEATFARGHCALGTAYYLLGIAEEDSPRFDQATAEFEAAIRVDSSLTTAYLGLGLTRGRQQQVDLSTAAYLAALALEPGNSDAAYRLSRIYERQDRFDEAKQVLNQAISRRPDCWIDHRHLAMLYFRAERYDDALDELMAASTFAPGDALTLNNIGAVHYLRDDWSEARTYFEAAFRIAPNCETCSNIGLLLYFEKRYSESADYYKFAHEYCDSTDYVMWGNEAISLYWSEDRRDEARPVFGAAIRLAEGRLEKDPDDPELIETLIDYYAYVGDAEHVKRMIDLGARVAGRNERVLFSIGHAYELAGDRELALRYIGDSIRRGFPLNEVERTPLLSSNGFIEDSRYKQMVADMKVEGSNEPGSTSPE